MNQASGAIGPLTEKDLRWLVNLVEAGPNGRDWSDAPARFAKLLRRGLAQRLPAPHAEGAGAAWRAVITAAGCEAVKVAA